MSNLTINATARLASAATKSTANNTELITSATKTVCVATNNADKAREISEILAIPGWEFKTLRELGLTSDPEETGTTFEENAHIKVEAARKVNGGMATLADDSGLSIDALDGAPGIYSARYAGGHDDDKANNEKVFAELKGVPFEERTARFVCSICFVDEDGNEITTKGTVEGKIGFECRGENGFGYDPLFFPDAFHGEKTFAEVSAAEKDALSHRGKALRELANKLLH